MTVAEEGLHRGLTRWHALAVVIGGMLGTGIYTRPASIAQLVGSPSSIMAVWIGTGLLSLAGALTYAALAARIPRSGGEYAFLRVTLGELPAFLFGWMRLTVGVGTIAGLAVAVTVFLSDLVPLAILNTRGVAKAGQFQTGITTIKALGRFSDRRHCRTRPGTRDAGRHTPRHDSR